MASSANYSFRLLDVGAAPALPLDTDLVGSINPGRSVVLYQLAGTAGQKLYFDGKGNDSGALWTLYGPNDAAVPGGSYITLDFELTLGNTGNYVLALSGNSDSAVNYTNRVVTFAYGTNALVLGTTISNTISRPGEQQYYAFSGVAGQRLYYDALDADFYRINVSLVTPSGVVRFLTGGNSDYDVGPFTLLETGAYTLIIDGAGDTVGNYSFRLLDVGAAPALPLDTDLVGSINPGRSVVLYQLAGTAGQKLYFDGKGNDSGAFWTLYGPNDAAVPGGSYITLDFELTLGYTGNYVLALSGNSDSAVNYTNRVVAFGYGTNALVLGTTISNTISRPGEQQCYTLSGVAGQRQYYDALDADFDRINV